MSYGGGENSLPLRQLFSQDGIVDQINFDNSDKNSVWQSENPNLANKNIQSIYGEKTLSQTKNIIIDLLKDPINSNNNNPALIRDPQKIKHPVRFF
ncbi:MAG: hypothetical protein Ct9H90mP2_02100 [Dehalococcoidia bacterium]|nr:MAG: hypothetical protein Ct9H90mP2_02100 [Dehalococcoidia bacterium]